MEHYLWTLKWEDWGRGLSLHRIYGTSRDISFMRSFMENILNIWILEVIHLHCIIIHPHPPSSHLTCHMSCFGVTLIAYVDHHCYIRFHNKQISYCTWVEITDILVYFVAFIFIIYFACMQLYTRRERDASTVDHFAQNKSKLGGATIVNNMFWSVAFEK